MVELLDGQFECAGAVWGDLTTLIVEDGEMPMAEVRNQDAVNAIGHGGTPGRDRLGFATWSWNLASDAVDGAHVLDVFEALASAWRTGLSTPPGELVELRYRVFGRTRRVFGRPRRYDPPKPNLLTSLGQGRGAIDFVLHDPFTYADDIQSLSLGRLAPVADGTVIPATIPFVIGTMPGVEVGAATVGGTAPTPFVVTFVGPVVNPVLEGPGFKIALDATLKAGQTVKVDTRDGTIVQGSGTNARGLLAQGSRLKARLQPGPLVLSYRGTDATNTSTATIAWSAAYNSL